MSALSGVGMVEGARIGSFKAHEAIAPYLRVKFHSTVGEVAIAGDEASIATALTRSYADGDSITVLDHRAPGIHIFIASNAITAGHTVSSVAGGKVQEGSGGTVTFGTALTSAGAGEQVSVFVQDPIADLTGLRANITQEDGVPYPILAEEWYLFDSTIHAPLGATALSADDLIYTYGAAGTAEPTITATDTGGATVAAQKARARVTLPPEYVAGQTITLRVNAKTATTISDDYSRIDFNVYRLAAPTVDICATSVQSINSLTAIDVDFTITPTDCVPGDVLDIVMSYTGHDTGNLGTMTPTINSASLLLDIKG